MSGRYEKKKVKRKRKPLTWKNKILIAICILVVLIIAVVIAGVVYYQSMLNKVNKVDVPKINYAELATETTEATEETDATEETTEATTVETTEPHVASSADYINFLVVGQAAREGETERFADTMILCTVNTYEKTLTMTSMLRDTLIKGTKYGTHTYGNIKLTTVYQLGYDWGGGISGSMELMNITLYNNFGIEVDYNFEIDFQGVVDVINLIGGIYIDLTQAEADYLNQEYNRYYYEMKEGRNWMDGSTALAYARMRKAAGDSDSDIIRTGRQRKMIEAVMAKLKTLSLSELQEAANKALPCISTSMTNSEITDMLLKLLPMITELEIKDGGTCPANYWGEMYDIYGDGMKQSILRFSETETKAYMRAITEGEGVIDESAE